MIHLLLFASLCAASPPRMMRVHTIRSAPMERPPQTAPVQPRAEDDNRQNPWIGRWIAQTPPAPVVVKVIHVNSQPPPPPKKTAWQLGPTTVENPGKPIAFDDLPSAFTPLPVASVPSHD